MFEGGVSHRALHQPGGQLTITPTGEFSGFPGDQGAKLMELLRASERLGRIRTTT